MLWLALIINNSFYLIVHLLFDLFTSAYASIVQEGFINLPIGLVTQPIDICFKYCGVLGEKKFWPDLDDWNRFIMNTRYMNYLIILIKEGAVIIIKSMVIVTFYINDF